MHTPHILEQDLMRPDAYPLPRPSKVELRETHVSWVFLTEGDAYKVKKPVSFGFLDFSTLDARRRACEAEVVLNGRLAASTYLGIVPIFRSSDGAFRLFGDGEVVDWAVHMLRLPDACRADQLLEAGQFEARDIDRIAEHLAAFHARCPSSPEIGAHGAWQAIARNVRENFAESAELRARVLSREEASEIERWQLGFIDQNLALLEMRRERGFVRDGHGDLRLDHVYLVHDPTRQGGRESFRTRDAGDGITILDCIEFADRFRCGDVVADIAFLSMDLSARGRVDLAERLLARYARAADDFDLYALVDFYESYRAYVRGKIALLEADAATDADVRAEAEADARRHFLLALSGARRPVLAPVVVAVGGVIASGKSTIADVLGRRLGAPVVDADRTRKRMAGVVVTEALHAPAFEGPYDPRMTSAVYAEVMNRAAIVVGSGRPVVLDASFRTREMRLAAKELAHAAGVPFLFVECRAPDDVCLARLDQRERAGSSVSDGRRAIFADFIARFEAVTELAASEHLVLDTTVPLETSTRELDTRVRTWPSGLHA